MKNDTELNKSIDTLLDEVFGEISIEKSIDIAGDAKTTADAAISQAPSMQKDEARGAGRPKQISDVPQNDMDGRRESQYDGAIADASGEKEPEEADQSPSIDQGSSKGRINEKPSSPKVAPFKKSVEVSEEEFEAFEAFKKAQSEAADKAKRDEELKKAEVVKREQEELVKSAVDRATESLRKENESLRKSFDETQALIKAIASKPQRPKSITGIDALEKSVAPEDKGSETFSKSEMLDAAFDLAKSGKIPADAVTELEMTNRIADAEVRALIEKKLQG